DYSLADVTGGRGMLNGSGIFFDTNKYYPHWYKNFFNKTIPLFGPYAWRADDFYDAFNWKNEWTNQTIQQEDIGAGRFHQYTSRYNRGNEWYRKWLPDEKRNIKKKQGHSSNSTMTSPNLTDDKNEKKAKSQRRLINENKNDTVHDNDIDDDDDD
ncbi:unnamed protein product, partial [Rotaria magnacalcarata]